MINELINWLFPDYCISCNKIGGYLCIKCQQRCKEVMLVEIGNYELNCLSFIDGIMAFYPYKKASLLVKLIHLFKYKGIKACGDILRSLLSHAISQNLEKIPELDIVTFIPIHKYKYRQRGFNQAFLLAQTAHEILKRQNGNLLLSRLLIKQKQTKSQMTLEREKRLSNINNCFVVDERNVSLITNQSIAIMDDILTTGATLSEAARVLKLAGAKKVYGLVFARHIKDNNLNLCL